jgi:stress-induced morphogen
MDPDTLRATLERAFAGAVVDVTDLTGTQDHYEVRIVASAFEGKSRIEQHKMVYRALGDALKGPVHALALKTSAPPRE